MVALTAGYIKNDVLPQCTFAGAQMLGNLKKTVPGIIVQSVKKCPTVAAVALGAVVITCSG